MRTIVVGCGAWGENYVRELKVMGSLVGVVEKDPQRNIQIHDKYKVCSYRNAEYVDIEFDAVVITTPPATHVELALPFLKSGKKVLIEKPMATSVEDAAKLYPYRDQIMVGHIYMHNPHLDVLKKYVGEVPINHAFARRTNDGPKRPWQDAMWDLAPHDVSIFNWLFGKPISYGGTFERDWAMLRVDYIGGIVAVIYVSWLGTPKVRTIELVPAEGYPARERFIYDDVGATYNITPLRRMLNAWLAGDYSRCTYNDGLDVIKVLDGVMQ